MRQAVVIAPLLTKIHPVTDGTPTKTALIEQVADVAGFTKRRAKIIVGALFGSIVGSLRWDENSSAAASAAFASGGADRTRAAIREPATS